MVVLSAMKIAGLIGSYKNKKDGRRASGVCRNDPAGSSNKLSPKYLKWVVLGLVLGVGIIYFSSNPLPYYYFDYTYRIAGAMLQGEVGLREEPPSWLNEMVPFEGRYYSVFPLGSVLTMLPLAVLQKVGLIEIFPSSIYVALLAAAIAFFFYLLSLRYELTELKRWMLVLLMMFGTWIWCNLAFGGAWQYTLGLAVLGQLGALYFILCRPNPFLAGLFFALAFGNRTEVILIAPLLMYLACRDRIDSPLEMMGQQATLWKFSAIPIALGLATLAYNYARFHSFFDFGYARIPGVLDEPWYKHGIFSLQAIPLNRDAMLFETWKKIDQYPYYTPTGFGGSIFLSCPFLFLIFRLGSRDFKLKVITWMAIVVLTFVLWLHGNPGGWQYSYRYALILLPWLFLLLLESSRPKITRVEAVLFVASVMINAYATYLFYWTEYVTP
jgi:hypothetical protein